MFQKCNSDAISEAGLAETLTRVTLREMFGKCLLVANHYSCIQSLQINSVKVRQPYQQNRGRTLFWGVKGSVGGI